MEENRGKRRQNTMGIAATLCVFALFAVLSLVLINVGVRVYKNVVLANNANFELRTSLSFLATRVRQSDEAGMVDVKEIDGRTALVLSEEMDGDIYDTLIYFQEGAVYELLTVRGFEADYEGAFQILEVDDLKIEKLSDSMICFTATNYSGVSEKLCVSLSCDS